MIEGKEPVWTKEYPVAEGWYWHLAGGWRLECVRVYECHKRGDTQKRLYVDRTGDQIHCSQNMRGDRTPEEYGGEWWTGAVQLPEVTKR